MGRLEQGTGWIRRATALASVLALAFHIVAMAFGAMDPPAPGGEITQVHSHHSASTAEHDAGGPSANPGHKPPCCVLSICPGLPAPPVDHVLAYLPQRTAAASVLEADAAPAAVRPPLRPVGARAPPLRA
jgi:hypothetical protein